MSNVIVLVTGSRSITDETKIWEKLDAFRISILPNQIIGLVEGDAEGVDKICKRWAISQGIPTHTVAATKEQWEEHGKKAGIMRNVEMFNYAKDTCDLKDALLCSIAFWDGSSTGTQHMINSIKKSGYYIDVHLMGKPKTKRLL
ncbi:GTP-binding domain [Erwinia phage vB_EamM-Bue1]|uniref:Chromosome segregation protein n=2 Tax=Nezavisimistyvirus TaxID=2841279 RepID=A0A2P1JUC2_9CAUD|nr:GTP-binding domain [Erwinia phage phiEa2809]YP_009837719.1 GTP-binding domain [Erwinia phage vB_EamM-Bue1]AIX13110.1 putative chromosome segregation protein [Erwinia phage phiEa2809]AVO22957.1 chromosome segregation protein [Erwinia phage vB_EamM-Bue1]